MVMLAVWTLLLSAVLWALAWRFTRRRALAGVVILVFSFAAALVIEFFAPPFGGYHPVAARYWMARAAAEPNSTDKEALVRRVAMASPEYGWFIASQAIGSVADPIQRCRLRTILAGIDGLRNRERLATEAGVECNATLSKGRGL